MKLLNIALVFALVALVFSVPSKRVRAATTTPPGVAIMWCEYGAFLGSSQKNFAVVGYDAPLTAPQFATDGSISCSAALGQLLTAGYAIHRTEPNAANNADPMFVLVTPSSLASIGN